MQNLNDDDNITGQFLNSAALGLSTNVFLMEPRRYGVDSQARIYNSPIDRIESWDNINAQITLAPDTYRWYFKVFVQNLNDDDNITGQFLNSAALGLSTNVFLMEPRRYGATFGINFD